ncbi:MAG: glycine--tRNA ligase subunit beta [Desulfobulbaceae bacterium]|nr:glycine--tRNA ligase subunit beta [Desulfobulbaceae bacterium]
MNELLFEIGTEEIPAGYIQPALQFMEDNVRKKFSDLGLECGQITTAGTPRRLTLAVDGLPDGQQNRRHEHIGPARKAGFDKDGNPTRAAMGFARSRGLAVEELQIVEMPKGEYLMAVEDVKGQATGELLPDLLKSLLSEIPFPKSMRWADSNMAFARPIQWLLALYDGAVVDFTVENVQTGATTLGHRFMAPDAIITKGFDHYRKELEKNSVIVDPARRRQMVIDEVRKAVKQQAGKQEAEPVLHEGLIDTVTNLVEIPWGVCGSFDEKFLQLPEEALVTSMREHQKYFSVADSQGKLMPLFVAVNNTRINDRELAASGHERVLRARLEDGLFFFNEDKKKKLEDHLDNLSGIIFQKKLGTMAAKSERIAILAAMLADRLFPEGRDDVIRAARLAKADLLTEMVGEFPSLQGIMGREYALLDGEKQVVATAIHEHYMPVRAGGALPAGTLGAIVGIADRMDTLAGCFAIGEKPTGNKDPFGLRRQAIGLISIISGLNLSLSLREMAEAALQGYGDRIEAGEETVEQVLAFIRLRFENEQIASGIRQEVVEAVTSVAFDNLVDCLARIQALDSIRVQEAFAVLAGSFKRIRNIIKENKETAVETDLFSEEAEKELYATLAAVREKALPMVWDRDYIEALQVMLEMKEPVDRFFDDVMVMVDDQAVRRNRLNLLTALGELVLQVGDISKMHVE